MKRRRRIQPEQPGDYRPFPYMPTYDDLLSMISRLQGDLDGANARLALVRTYLARTPAAVIVNRHIIEEIS